MTGILTGFAIVLFVLAFALFVMDSPVIGGACVALGASMMAISAASKKSDHG
jgi:hypothetical protein